MRNHGKMKGTGLILLAVILVFMSVLRPHNRMPSRDDWITFVAALLMAFVGVLYLVKKEAAKVEGEEADEEGHAAEAGSLKQAVGNDYKRISDTSVNLHYPPVKRKIFKTGGFLRIEETRKEIGALSGTDIAESLIDIDFRNAASII